VDEYLKQQQKRETRLMRNKLHPSTIGMCQRRIVFDMLMVPVAPHDSRLLKVFENGHSVHERYQKLFADMGILLEEEMRLEKGDISGRTDALIKLYTFDNQSGKELLVELKSAAEKSFKWMKEKNTPKVEHKAQLQFYMHLSGVHDGILFVENKDTQEIWEYPMYYDSDYGQELEQKAMWCIDLAKARMVPPIPPYYTPSAYKCSICSYNFYCHYGNLKKNGEERYPIPFNFGSPVYFDALDIINAMKNNQPIPDVILGDTNGDLAVQVEERNKVGSGFPTVQQMITKYI
jgi:hypothetical protein